MKHRDLKTKENPALQEKLKEAREKLIQLRFGAVNRQVKNVREIRVLRSTIARILTLIQERSQAPSSTATPPKV